MQHARGFIVGCANGWLWSPWEAEHTEQQIGQAFYMQKTILSAYYIRVTKWLVTCLQSNPIGTNFEGYMFTKQSCRHKLHGLLFKFKAILLVQTARAFLKLRPRGLLSSLAGFYWVHIDWLAPGHLMGAVIPPFHGKPKPKSWPPASPSPGSPT